MIVILAIVAVAVAVGTPLGIAGYYEYQRRQLTDWSKEPVIPWS